MTTPSLMPNLFLPLSIYNDAADAAVRRFRQRHLFDEIEQEVNLVWDQLVYTLASQLWAYYKNIASKILIDKSFERGLASHKIGARMNYGRFHSVLKQTHFKLIGRTIDVSEIVTSHINNTIRENINALLDRFEGKDITNVVEMESLLNTLKLALEMMRHELPAVDSFEEVFREMNEDTTLGSFQGRLFVSTYQHIVQGLFKNYIYNDTTQRFVNIKSGARKEKKRSKKDKTLPVYKWGPKYTQIIQTSLNSYKGFFGIEHIKAMLNILGDRYIGLTIDECIKVVEHNIVNFVGQYYQQLIQALDPMENKDPRKAFGTLGVFNYFKLRLKNVDGWGGKGGMYAHIREVGNCICFIRLLSSAMTQNALEEFQCRGFYEGVRTPRRQGKESVEHSQASYQFLKPKQSPFARHITDAASQVALPKRTREFLETIVADAEDRAQFFEPTTEGWLMTVTFERLYATLEADGFLEQWRGPLIPSVSNGLIDHENPKDFARFWSAILFLFLIPEQQAPQQQQLAGMQNILTDRQFHGDGWAWGGTVILYLLGLRSRWKLLDYSMYLDRIQKLFPEDLNPVKKKKNAGPFEEDKPYLKSLLNEWSRMRDVMENIFSILESHYPEPKLPIRPVSARYQWTKPKKIQIGGGNNIIQ